MTVLSDKWIKNGKKPKNDISICLKQIRKGKIPLAYHHTDMTRGIE